MQVVVPYAAHAPKTRLEPLLDADERESFARAMLADVLEAIEGSGRTATVLSTDTVDVDAAVIVDERPLTEAVDGVLVTSDEPVAVVMADLALATPTSLDELFETEGDVVIAPGRGGGTNALVVRHPGFRTDYHGVSYRDHLAIARNIGASVEVVDSFRLSTDVDEPEDLVEVLLHGGDRSSAWLERHGFGIESGEGRVSVVRESDERPRANDERSRANDEPQADERPLVENGSHER